MLRCEAQEPPTEAMKKTAQEADTDAGAGPALSAGARPLRPRASRHWAVRTSTARGSSSTSCSSEHSDQKELLERARTYRAMCNTTPSPRAAEDVRGAAELRRHSAQSGRIRPGGQVPPPGARDPAPQRECALLPRRGAGPGGRSRRGACRRCARRSAPTRRHARWLARTTTSSRCAERSSSGALVSPTVS